MTRKQCGPTAGQQYLADCHYVSYMYAGQSNRSLRKHVCCLICPVCYYKIKDNVGRACMISDKLCMNYEYDAISITLPASDKHKGGSGDHFILGDHLAFAYNLFSGD